MAIPTPKPKPAANWNDSIRRVVSMVNIARITILFSLLILSAMLNNLSPYIGTMQAESHLMRNQGWLLIWCSVYGAMVMLGLALPKWYSPQWQIPRTKRKPNAGSVADITMMAVLAWLAGGVSSGFAILMLPFLAVACVLSYGSYPLLYGSYAAMMVMIDIFLQFYPFDSDMMGQRITLFAGQVLMIFACYAVPLLTSVSTRYLVHADTSLRHQRSAYEQLSALNKIVLNRVQEAVLVLDSGCRVVMFNRKAKQYFNDIETGKPVPLLQMQVKRWLSGPQHSFEMSATLAGALMHIRAMPLIQHEIKLLTLFIRSDKERQTEAQTVKLTSLGMLTANLAHEIRNPLSAMRQSNGLILETAKEDDNLMVERLSGIIEKNIARVDKMIEDVSTLNKSDRLNPEVIHIMKWWMGFTQEFYLTRPEAKGCLKLDMAAQPLEAVFDAMHLHQIVWNLCNNAWRHSQKQKNSVVVRIRGNRSHIAIRVWDDGPGVAESMQAHLFEPFHTNQSDGTGLGLYIARELAHANKGDLDYLPQEKSFELILPRHSHDTKQP